MIEKLFIHNPALQRWEGYDHYYMFIPRQWWRPSAWAEAKRLMGSTYIMFHGGFVESENGKIVDDTPKQGKWCKHILKEGNTWFIPNNTYFKNGKVYIRKYYVTDWKYCAICGEKKPKETK